MDFFQYQKLTQETAIYGDEIDEILRGVKRDLPWTYEKLKTLLSVCYVGLGLGESGEVQNKLKKIIRDSKGDITDKARKAISEELGGQLYYIARVCEELGISMNKVAENNISILSDRKERGVIKGSGDNR